MIKKGGRSTIRIEKKLKANKLKFIAIIEFNLIKFIKIQ